MFILKNAFFKSKAYQLFLITCCFFITNVSAKVRLASAFADNMVLQREATIKVWGWASKDEKVSVTIADKTYTTQANANGDWFVLLDLIKVGGPYTMKVKGDNEIIINNILSGDVWFCAGQSNMNFPLKSSTGAADAIKNSTNKTIRLLTVPRTIGFTAKATTKRSPSWLECTPETVPDFSAVAYYTGKIINEKINVPIGLIHCSYGGTIIEDWLPKSYTDTMIAYKDILALTNGKDEQVYIDDRNKNLLTSFPGVKIFEDEKVLWDTINVTPPTFQYNWNTIQLPNFWETIKGLENIDGIAWFYKTIMLTKDDVKGNAVLSLGRIADQGIVYINGVRIGSSPADRYTLRKFGISTSVFKEGENTIIVRVANKRKDGGLWGPKEEMYLQTATKKTSITGSWQYWFQQARANIHPNDLASSLYNGMVSPFIGYAIKGFIWYQGESNLKNGTEYNTHLTAMIKAWRKAWANESLHFNIVQLPNNKKRDTDPNKYADWAVLRDAQLKALSQPNTSLVTTFDVGDANDVHPTNKQTVGERIANQLLNKVYHQNVQADGPIYESYKIDKDKIIIQFKKSNSKMVFKNGCSTDSVFAIAGANQKFYWAKASIENNTIIISKDVARPIAVRYAWGNNPCVLLYNEDNIPASPFRTDDWNVSNPKGIKESGE